MDVQKAKRSGGVNIIDEDDQSLRRNSMWLNDQENVMEQVHPYKLELDNFKVPLHQLKPPAEVKVKFFGRIFNYFFVKFCYFQPSLPIESTPLVMVDSEEKLNQLVQTLNNSMEFAVDLEHHNYRFFMQKYAF